MPSSEDLRTTALTVVKIGDLLPLFRDVLVSAFREGRWDVPEVERIVRNEFDFLGAFTSSSVTGDGADPDAYTLSIAFAAPPNRDLVRAEQRFSHATTKADRGDLKGAKHELSRLVTEFPEIAKFHRALGHAHLELGSHDDAEDELLRALALDARDADALTLLGNLYARRKQPHQAIPLYERSLALHRTVQALVNLGAMVSESGDNAGALRHFEAAVTEEPTYPNAWLSLAIALTRQRDPAHLARAAAAADRALALLATRKTNPAMWDAAAKLANDCAQHAAAFAEPVAEHVNAGVADEEGKRSGYPVRFEQQALSGIVAKIEYAWLHTRTYHRVISTPTAGVERAHQIRHELEHLRLTNLARASGRNRWFASSTLTRAKGEQAVAEDVRKIKALGLPEASIAQLMPVWIDGILLQVYNFPVDLLIESRLLASHPDLRELVFVSIHAQLKTAVGLLENRELKRMTPRAVFRANMAMNGAMALWFESQFPHRTDFAARFRSADSGALSERLYGHWTAAAADWTPGAELDWVDAWATMMGLRPWYEWLDGNR